jgi:hypothetical protein
MVGGGTVPALPCGLAERRWHFDVFGGWVGVFVCGLCVVLLLDKKTKKHTNKNTNCYDIGLLSISFEPPVLQW